jgi:dual specificity MAP kinase phosphatase
VCDWIEAARLEGGKVLVHCRVGVSRSATVTVRITNRQKIVYSPSADCLCDETSGDAFGRRLSPSTISTFEVSIASQATAVCSRNGDSVLIQPNLRLLYNLCSWEVEIAQERAKDDPTAMNAFLSRRLSWPYLAREVHLLNEKYIQ